jgi:phytoene synthase
VSTIATAIPDVEAAYRHCEHVTRTQARNFAYGITLLPGDKRRALSAVYALARRIDDIGDGDLPPGTKLAALAQARAEVIELAGGGPAPAGDLVLVALGDAARRFPIPVSAFGELIEGCEADVRGMTYRTFSELEHYCRCVAGSIGRLSLGVFGCADPAVAEPLADSLGVALQLTNILRDIREDLGNGRVYLPAEDLKRFGCTLEPGGTLGPYGTSPAGPGPATSGADGDSAGGTGSTGPAGNGAGGPAAGRPVPGAGGGMERLIRFEADRARGWYARGLALMPLLDWRSKASTGAMAGIYLRLLDHMSATPATVLQERMSLPAQEKLLVAGRSLLGRTPVPRSRS